MLAVAETSTVADGVWLDAETASSLPRSDMRHSAIRLMRHPVMGLLSRIAAAVFGGYAVSNLLSLALVGWLPMERADAVMTAMLLSFVIYTAAITWVFAASSAWRAWVGLLLPGMLAGLLLLIYGS